MAGIHSIVYSCIFTNETKQMQLTNYGTKRVS